MHNNTRLPGPGLSPDKQWSLRSVDRTVQVRKPVGQLAAPFQSQLEFLGQHAGTAAAQGSAHGRLAALEPCHVLAVHRALRHIR